MDMPTTAIILRGGPSDGDVIGEVAASQLVYHRLARPPDARYRDTGTVDGAGRRIFDYVPPKGS